MCEPNHSIVQWNDPDNPEDRDDGDDGGGMASAQSNRMRVLSTIGQWAKKVGKWFHISRMGAGHSQALGKISTVSLWSMHKLTTNYECEWWKREVKLDGSFHGSTHNIEQAKLAVTKYCNDVSIGSLSALRRFLEASFRLTDEHSICLYLNMIRKGLLNERGQLQFDSRLRLVQRDLDGFSLRLKDDKEARNKVARWALWFTRQRNLLVPEWADDSGLWLP